MVRILRIISLCLTLFYSVFSFATFGERYDSICHHNNDVIVSDTTVPVISLIGESRQTMELYEKYQELGATATDEVDGDLTSTIVIDSSNVNVEIPGFYSVWYSVSDLAGNSTNVSREVVISDSPPTITLIGEVLIEIYQDEMYSDLGAHANDAVDGDISSQIVINSSAVDVALTGQYEVIYTVTDSGGSSVSLSRQVIVVQSPVSHDEKKGGSIGLFVFLLVFLRCLVRQKS